MGKCFIKVRIHCFLYLNLAFFYESCDFPQIVWSDVIWGQLCEIAPLHNTRCPAIIIYGKFLRGCRLTFFKGNCCVFEFRVCIYFIPWLRPSLNYNRFSVLHAVDSLNDKHKLQSKRVKQFCQLYCIMYSFQIKLMNIMTSQDGINGRSIEMLLSE